MRVPSGSRPVREVGEFPLIDLLAGTIDTSRARGLVLGIGDDAAVWRPTPGRETVATTDTLVEGVHFRLDWTDWQTLGHKALAVNLSDLAAMGAVPRLALVSLGLRGEERDRDLIDLYRGMNALAGRCGATVVGGDVVSSPQAVTITVTAIGESQAGGKPLLTRSAAHPGDRLGLTGPIGLAAAGLRVMQQGLMSLDGRPAMLRALNRPEPRVAAGRVLAWAGVRAAMDLSDGLLGDLPKMCALSGVSAIVDLVRLPIPHAVQWAFDDWLDVALRGGEDYELLFAAPPEAVQRVERAFRRLRLRGPLWIGEVVPAGDESPVVKLRDAAGRVTVAEPGAFSHFG